MPDRKGLARLLLHPLPLLHIHSEMVGEGGQVGIAAFSLGQENTQPRPLRRGL
jgi:hypothetical protein